jgi:hypothetical protein
VAPGNHHNPTIHRPSLAASGSNYGLSPMECRTEFAGLFEEIDRSVALRKEMGNVSLADIDLSWKPYGGVRVMIYNHKVIFVPCLLDLSTRCEAYTIICSSTSSRQDSTDKATKKPAFSLLSTKLTAP